MASKTIYTKYRISKVTLPDPWNMVQDAMDGAVRFTMGIIIKDLRHILGLEITQYARIKLLWELIDRLEKENIT